MQALTLAQIAEFTETKLVGNPKHLISDIDVLENAGQQDVSFLSNPRYKKLLQTTSAGAIFVPEGLQLTDKKNYLISKNPSEAIQRLLDAFRRQMKKSTAFDGIHPTAIIHESAKIDPSVSIGPYTVVDEQVEIGPNTKILPHCYIGPSSTIGEDCLFHAHVTIRERTIIHNRVILQPGCVVGSCGYGYIQNERGEHIKLSQMGYVEIEDDVEIGANSTIDRARFKKTIIQRGSKLDNLVQIAHNVKIGKHNIIISQAGIAGSTETGDYCVFGGQSAAIGHMKIADRSMIAAGAAITKSTEVGGKYGGRPAEKISQHNRNQVYYRNLDKWCKRIEELENKIEELTYSPRSIAKKDRV